MKKQNNFLLYLTLGIAFGLIFHKLALGMILGMAIGIMLDARAAKQSAQDKANYTNENKGNADGENADVNDPK